MSEVTLSEIERRLAVCEQAVKDLSDKITATDHNLAATTTTLNSVLATLGELKGAVESLKARPATMWDKLVYAVIGAAVAAGITSNTVQRHKSKHRKSILHSRIHLFPSASSNDFVKVSVCGFRSAAGTRVSFSVRLYVRIVILSMSLRFLRINCSAAKPICYGLAAVFYSLIQIQFCSIRVYSA